ncbi:hypothetical protein GCK32_014719 [Trichostrongylus colubriformis]|uniref:Uncharacterized protein n=1 Tax=Trichostrongylus colubriformis TaxID=6319 RepID=A0AAN8GC35_TRICO
MVDLCRNGGYENGVHLLEFNGFSLYNPVVTTGARISISRPAKARRNVCSQPEVRRYSSVRSRPSKLHITTPQLKHRDDEPSRPSLPPPPLAAAPISISRNAKVTGEVCNEKSKPRSQLQYPKSISWVRKAPVKRLSGPRRPLISFVKSIPSVVKKNDVSAVMPAAPKYPTLYKKRSAVAPCLLRHRSCSERNITRKPCKGSKALVANLPTRQLSTYKRRPLAPSWPPLPRRPCVERSDAVQCWKALQDQTTQLKNTRYDWFTRRGQIRAENRRH